jgi:hypothetical protein
MLDMLMQNKLAVIVVALMVAAGAWYTLGGGGGGEETALVTEDFTSPASEADRDLVATLLELRSVRLDGNVFSDPAFQSLKDFGSQIVPEPVGRPNPFAPFEGQAASAGETVEPKTAPKTVPKTVPGGPKQKQQ